MILGLSIDSNKKNVFTFKDLFEGKDEQDDKSIINVFISSIRSVSE
jgi:hypothetical protein